MAKARAITEMPDEGAILDTLVVMQEEKRKKGRKSRKGKEMYITKKTCPALRSVSGKIKKQRGLERRRPGKY